MDLHEATEALVEHIRSTATNENPWVTIPQREIVRIANVSSYYCKKLTEKLRLHPDVYVEVDNKTEASKKPYRYRILSPEEKQNMKFVANQFYYLSQEEIDYIDNLLTESKIATEYNEKLQWITWISMLTGLTKDRQWTMYDLSRISTLMLDPISETTDRMKTMEKLGLITLDAERCNYHITFLPKSQHEIMKKVEEKRMEIEPSKTEEQIIALPRMENYIQDLNEKLQTLSSVNLSAAEELISNMKDFQNFFAESLSAVLEEQKKNSIQEFQIIEGQQVVKKLLTENHNLKEQITKLERDQIILINSLEKAQKRQEEFTGFAQERFELMFAQIANLLGDFVKIPKWKLNNIDQYNAALQKNVIESVSTAIQEIVAHKVSA